MGRPRQRGSGLIQETFLSMRIGIPAEIYPGETRVAATPETVKKLAAGGRHSITVQAGAGRGAFIADADFQSAGAVIAASAAELYASSDIVLKVRRPEASELPLLRRGTVLVGLLSPHEGIDGLAQSGVNAFALELLPRITRAQAMDALSSMATVAGYKAVLLGADRIPRMFPLLMTAAGTVPPARVLVLGAGVAGLQAIATARRLGAVVEAYDVRAAAGEQVRSLGATFLEVDLGGIQTEDKGGYAVELSEEALKRGRDLVAEHAKAADVIITTAQVPGRRAPLLMDEAAVNGMKRGSIVIDLAGATRGNVTGTKPDETVERDGITIMAPTNLPATVPVHASQLYSRNVSSFLNLLIKDGELHLDMNDDVVGPSCVTHEGKWMNQRVAAAMGAAA